MRQAIFCIVLIAFLFACTEKSSLDLDSLADRAEFGDRSAREELVKLLGRTENDIGAKVYPKVVELGPDMTPYLLAAVDTPDREQRERVLAALGTLRSVEAVEPIARILADPSLKRRYVAAWALGEIGSKAAVAPLLKALGDRDRTVRQYATRSLIKINRPAVEPLLDHLVSADVPAAAGAIRALGDIGDKRALDALLRQADGPNREEAYLALGKLREPAAETALIEGLKDPAWRMRMNAAMALGPVGTARSVEPLKQTLDDEVTVVREWSARSLSVITGKLVEYRDAEGKLVEPYNVYH